MTYREHWNASPWCLLEATDNCEEATALFYDFVEAAVADVVLVVRPCRPSPPWFDREVCHAPKAKQRAFRTKKRSQLLPTSNFSKRLDVYLSKWLGPNMPTIFLP